MSTVSLIVCASILTACACGEQASATSMSSKNGVKEAFVRKETRGTPASEAVPPASLARLDIIVGRAGIARALSDAGVLEETLSALDAGFCTRVDLFAAAIEGKVLTLWIDGARLDATESLVAAELVVGRSPLIAAHYDGALAPRGFYDDRGFSLNGPLRARPVELSRVTSQFGERFDPITGASAVHRGIDYAVPVGTAVLAAGVARVKARGKSASAGNFLKLMHAGGFESWYLHLDGFEPGTEVGARVAQNQIIARSGNTGRSTGPHVHYELRLAGEALDPERTMPIPDTALGPLALRQHRAFIQQLRHLRPQQRPSLKEATR